MIREFAHWTEIISKIMNFRLNEKQADDNNELTLVDPETDATAISTHPNEGDSQHEMESVEVDVAETEKIPTSTDQSNEGSSCLLLPNEPTTLNHLSPEVRNAMGTTKDTINFFRESEEVDT